MHPRTKRPDRNRSVTRVEQLQVRLGGMILGGNEAYGMQQRHRGSVLRYALSKLYFIEDRDDGMCIGEV